MKRLLLLTAIFMNSAYANAEAFLCVTEAVAGVKQGESIATEATVYSPNAKYILSEDRGKWTLKEFGSNSLSMPCRDSRYCGYHIEDPNKVPIHIFTRIPGKDFTYISGYLHNDENGNYNETVVRRGLCESI